jgi:hypothetical protein
VLLSYEFWRRAYGADPSLPGKKITLNGATHMVVGIAPAGFCFPPKDRLMCGPHFRRPHSPLVTVLDAPTASLPSFARA